MLNSYFPIKLIWEEPYLFDIFYIHKIRKTIYIVNDKIYFSICKAENYINLMLYIKHPIKSIGILLF